MIALYSDVLNDWNFLSIWEASGYALSLVEPNSLYLG